MNANGTENSEKRHRVQFDMSTSQMDRLEKMREKTEASTKAEVVRRALLLYEWFVDQRDAGNQIQVLEGDTAKDVIILI